MSSLLCVCVPHHLLSDTFVTLSPFCRTNGVETVGGVVGRERRVRLDVRWDPDDVTRAEGIAAGRGVRPGVVMREAVKIGLGVLVGRGGETSGAGVDVERLSAEGIRGAAVAMRESSGGGGIVPGAGTAPPAGPSAPIPRPVPAAAPAVQRQKLVIVVARRLAGGAPQPMDVARARRRVELGSVKVDGVVVKDPDALVVPGAVAV